MMQQESWKPPVNSEEETVLITRRIQKIIHHTDDIFELQIDRKNIHFTPGQYVSIYTDDLRTQREYSIASGIHDNYLSFLIKHLDQGMVTDYLFARKVGDLITISEPQGLFRPGKAHKQEDFIFIATGTGIAPFLSYLKSFPENPPHQILYGVRYLKDLIGYDFIQSKSHCQAAVSRESSPAIHKGRVTDLLPDIKLHSNLHFYLCGLDSMIKEVSQWLEEQGIQSGNIHHEIFFYSQS
jgi:ferredoxin-NADP reductase